MPNYTTNRLTIAGDPEWVEDFIRIHGQSLREVAYDEPREADALMIERPVSDFRYSGLAPNETPPTVESHRALWGCKWDTGGGISQIDCAFVEGTIASETHFRQGLTLRFSSPSSSPSAWFSKAVKHFPRLRLVMTSDDEDGNDEFTVSIGQDGHEEIETVAFSPPSTKDNGGEDEQAIDDDDDPDAREYEARRQQIEDTHASYVGAGLPDHSFVEEDVARAIRLDDEALLQAWLDQPRRMLDAPVAGHWSPVHYAAHHLSVRCMALLAERGARLDMETATGLKPIDMIIDARLGDGTQPLMDRRLHMLEILAERRPSLLAEPLRAGMLPIEFAARWGMSPILGKLIEYVDVSASSSHARTLLTGDEDFEIQRVDVPAWLILLANSKTPAAARSTAIAMCARHHQPQISQQVALYLLDHALRNNGLEAAANERVVLQACEVLMPIAHMRQVLAATIEDVRSVCKPDSSPPVRRDLEMVEVLLKSWAARDVLSEIEINLTPMPSGQTVRPG